MDRPTHLGPARVAERRWSTYHAGVVAGLDPRNHRRTLVLIAAGVVAVLLLVVLFFVRGGDELETDFTLPDNTDDAPGSITPTTAANDATSIGGSTAPSTPASEPAPGTTVADPAVAAPTTVPPPVESAGQDSVLFETSFDVPGTGVDNGMVLPSYGPHLTPRPGIVANGALFRDPNMTEWEDVLLRAPLDPLLGDRYVEAEITVLANGEDAHPAIGFFDDPGNTSGGCAGGSTMDWAEVDPWNNMQPGRISFVIDGCYDSTSHVFAGTMGEYQTYVVRAELRGNQLSMILNGEEIAVATVPAEISIPYAGLRIGQFGNDGGYEQYRIERFETGLLL